jgi:hypothetical protein
MPADLSKQYETENIRQLNALARRLRKIYVETIINIAFRAAAYFPEDSEIENFKLSSFPILEKAINAAIGKMHSGIFTTLISGIENSWALANQKNDLFVDRRLAGRLAAKSVAQILYDPNLEAMKAFIDRVDNGLNLSDRVWNTLEPFSKEIEQGLGIGISQGQSAAKIAQDMQQYLNQPDRLYRRVQSESGLVLSKAARNYSPGQGVYRSSYQNALRLTATETNMSYRSSDYERWQKLPFVVGIEIHTSNNHPEYDICDELQGDYPKDFKFTGWHPRCLCFSTPKQLTDSEYDKYEDELLGLGEFDGVSSQQVEDVPEKFKDYLDTNQKRIAGWKNTPYWIRDNPEYIS